MPTTMMLMKMKRRQRMKHKGASKEGRNASRFLAWVDAMLSFDCVCMTLMWMVSFARNVRKMRRPVFFLLLVCSCTSCPQCLFSSLFLPEHTPTKTRTQRCLSVGCDRQQRACAPLHQKVSGFFFFRHNVLLVWFFCTFFLSPVLFSPPAAVFYMLLMKRPSYGSFSPFFS